MSEIRDVHLNFSGWTEWLRALSATGRSIAVQQATLQAFNAELQQLVPRPTDPRLNLQQTYVVRRLRERGDRGIHSFELRQEYIGNPSQRINELRAYGYVIPEPQVREKLNGKARGVRYRLTGEPDLDLVCDAGVAGVDDCDVPEHSGGPTDPAEPASIASAGGHHLVRDVESADGPTDDPPPSVGGQLFSTARYMEAA